MNVKRFLDIKVEEFNRPDFISDDPVSIPHRFSLKQDIEITAFFAAILAWGQRKTIINKTNELISFMDNAPFDFIKTHQEQDLQRFLHFKHRTFNATDALYFIHFLHFHYQKYSSLEDAFSQFISPHDASAENGLIGFHNYFFSLEAAPHRTKKHISTPANKSLCKRLNMFLRWMVRKDDKGVDFGIWPKIQPHQLLCPMDVHVERVARKLNLIERKQRDWRTVIELTENLKKFDPEDPVKYDFALFGMGVSDQF